MNNEEIKFLIKELVEKTTAVVKSVSVKDSGIEDKNTWFEVEVNYPQLFLNHGGEALFALNHLVRKMVENKMPQTEEPRTIDISIDINGFQKKRIESVRAVAHMMAERARYFKSKIEVDPMSAYERRIVHEFLANEADIKTESEGAGLSRRVVIKYIGSI